MFFNFTKSCANVYFCAISKNKKNEKTTPSDKVNTIDDDENRNDEGICSLRLRFISDVEKRRRHINEDDENNKRRFVKSTKCDDFIST